MRPGLWWQVLMDQEPAPGGGGDPPVFDHAKFTADADKRFKAIEKGHADVLAAITALKPKDPVADPDPDPNDKKLSPEVKALQKQLADHRKQTDALIEENKKAKDEARAEKRTNALTQELGKLGVAPERIKSALRAVGPDIKFAEDGSLVGEDDAPITEYLANWIKSNDHFLPPKSVSGAGASGGQRRGEKSIQLEDIKPGMKPEDRQRADEQIKSVLGLLGR